ncbi:MAG: hypothetical protein H0U95_02510 [Bacteroidetes bacterium]|nr:hypothetical protein [Bacteroidota bacterium]
MKDPKKNRFAIIILIVFALDLLIKYFFGSIYIGGPKSFLTFAYVAVTIILLFKGKITGWYMATFYSIYNLTLGSISLISFYIMLTENSGANWGGLLSFIYPIPEIIVELVAVLVCIKKSNREFFEIKL